MNGYYRETSVMTVVEILRDLDIVYCELGIVAHACNLALRK